MILYLKGLFGEGTCIILASMDAVYVLQGVVTCIHVRPILTAATGLCDPVYWRGSLCCTIEKSLWIFA